MRSRVTPFTRDDSGPIVGPGFVTDHAIIVAFFSSFSFSSFSFIFSPFDPAFSVAGRGEREGNSGGDSARAGVEYEMRAN